MRYGSTWGIDLKVTWVTQTQTLPNAKKRFRLTKARELDRDRIVIF